MSKANIIFISKYIFTAKTDELIDGYVAIADNKILSIGKKENYKQFVDNKTEVIDLGDKLITPGFSDVHCFFMGYMLKEVGTDFSDCTTYKEVVEKANKENAVFGHGLDLNRIKLPEKEEIDKNFNDRSIIVFDKELETCLMNDLAIKKYKFTPDKCYPESYWRIFADIIKNKNFITEKFKKYMNMMNSRGITSVKEMGFDDYYGFTEILKDLEQNNLLTLRVHFMSQPVGYRMNLDYALESKEKFKSDWLKFSGFNQMTDGSISQFCGFLKEKYNSKDTYCEQDINWEELEADTIKADTNNIRFSLHAPGDAAISKVLDIYEKCKKDNNGKLVNRHSITDLEFSDPVDLERMGKMGVIAEIYPQIMSLYNREDKIKMTYDRIGENRAKYYWNRRKMQDSNVLISCATDLPLLIDNIPESIYHSCGGFFADGKVPFNENNTINRLELMKAWTYGGQYNLYSENKLGTLEENKIADLVVMNENIFETPLEKIRDSYVCLTMVNGNIVYNKKS